MNKRLNFVGSVGHLYGRDELVSTLESRIANHVQGFKDGDAVEEIILLYGYSGCGKSALLQSAREFLKDHDVCLIAKTKCDPADPYSILSNAFGELCVQVMESKDASKVAQKLQDAFSDSGASLLRNTIPKLSLLLPESCKQKRHSQNRRAITRLRLLFQKLVEVLCEATSKMIVMTMDDLQWIDVQSLEILTVCIKTPAFLLLGNYRENEVGPSHPLTVALQELPHEVTKIPVGNLEITAVNQIIASASELSLETTMPLAQVVFQKTHGNVLFVLQFLEILQDKELLFFSLKTYQWTWDVDKILKRTDLSDNVVDVVISRLQLLPKSAQFLLKIASCLGCRFPVQVVQAVLEKQTVRNDQKCDDKDVAGLLETVKSEGLVDEISTNTYKFAHDRIQQAAFELEVDGVEQEQLHLCIGITVQEMSEGTDEWMLFVATQQLNHGSKLILESKAKRDLAVLNCNAAKLAIRKSAFQPAAEYLENGLRLLGNEKWETDYKLTLEMTISFAEMAACVGNYDASSRRVKEVIEKGKFLTDKLPAYLTLVESYGAQGKFNESLDLCFLLLKDLGYKLPKRVRLIHIVPELLRLKRMLRGRSDDDLLNLPEMTDSHKIAVCKALMGVTFYAWYVNKMDYLSLAYIRLLSMSIKFGMNDTTATSFVNYGIILSFQGDREAARFYALANALEKKTGTREPRINTTICVFHSHHVSPLHQVCDNVLESHLLGMECGDVEGALLASHNYCLMYFHSGLKLDPLKKDLYSFAQQCKEYNQVLCLDCMEPIWTCLQGLGVTGASQEESSSIFSSRQFEDIDNAVVRGYHYQAQTWLSCFLGNHEAAIAAMDVMKSDGDIVSELPAVYHYSVTTFYYGLSSLALAGKSNKRRHLKNGKRAVKRLKKLVMAGSVNCHHLLSVLEAELASMTTTLDDALKSFDRAISTCRRAGFPHVEAIANERAGEYSLAKGDTYWAATYLSRSRALYIEWGAIRKANQLLEKHGELLNKVDEEDHMTSMGGTMRGRQRFETKHSERHKRLSVFGEHV